MKRKVLTLLLAIIMVLTSIHTDAFVAASTNTAQSTDNNQTTENSEEKSSEDNLKTGDKTVVTEEEKEEHQTTTSETSKENETSETTSETQKVEENEKTSEDDADKQDDQKNSDAEDSKEEVKETAETMEALFAISWKDGSNKAKRRPKEISDLVQIYADGEKLDNKKLTIRLLNKDTDGDGKADADEEYGLETYYYVISDLPVYKEESVSKDESSDEKTEEQKTKINYTLKEDSSAIKGYEKIDTKVLDFDDGKPKGSLLAPEDEMTLSSYEGKNREDTDRFVNYLPEYTVSGSITWELDDADMSASDVIDMKEYFEKCFDVKIGDLKYQYHTFTYNKDDKNENVWNYSISGLYKSDKDGKEAAYTLNPSVIEGLEVSPASETISKDRQDADFCYQLTEAGIATLDVGDDSKTEYTYKGEASTNIVWYDPTGTSENEHKGELKLKVSYKIGDQTYTITNFQWNKDESGNACYVHTYTKSEMEKLGLPEGAKLYLYDKGENSLNRTLSVNGVTSQIKTTTGEGDNEKVTTQDVSWTIEVTGVEYTPKSGSDITGYSVYKNTDDSYRLYSLTNMEVNVEVRAGHDQADFWDTYLYKAMGLEFDDYDGDKYSSTELAAYFKANYGILDFKVDLNQENGVCSISNLPFYDGDKKQIEYAVIMKDSKLDPNPDNPDEWYTIEYDNTAVPGYGTTTTKAHDGGTVILTRTGKTDYSAYKIWQDEEDENEDHIGDDRPETTWTLWRYSDKNGSYETAAQVFTDLDGQSITVTAYGCDEDSGERLSCDSLLSKLWSRITGSNYTEEMEITEWQTHGYTVEEFVIGKNLPMYDSEGYRYIYFAREAKNSSDWMPYYGSKAKDSGLFADTDVLPDGVDTRASDDTSIYDKGAVSNRKTDTTTVSVTKTWIAAYYQDQLSNLEVELTLQAKHKTDQESYGGGNQSEKNNWYTVTDGDGNDVTATLSGFNAYDLTKTQSVQTDKYCDSGHELVFRWKESQIYEVSTDEKTGEKTRKEIKPSTEEGETRYRLTINQEAIQNDSYEHSDEYFVSEESDEYVEAGGNYQITNTLEGYTEYYVKKTWKNSDNAGSIDVTLERISSTGEVTEIKKSLSAETLIWKDSDKKAYDGDYTTGDSGWIHLFEDLPKYDQNGNLYNYIVREANNGYEAEYQYGFDVDGDDVKEKNAVQITNDVPGVENHIDVRKTWLDDSVTEGRDTCYFAVYASNGQLLYGTIDNEQGFLSEKFVEVSENSKWWKRVNVTMFTYKKGDSQILLYKDGDQYISSDGQKYDNWKVIMNAIGEKDEDYASEQDWQEKHLYEDGFYITEYKVGDNLVDTENTNSMNYPKVQSHDSEYAVIYYHEKNDKIANYYNTNKVDSEGYYTIINRRIGKMSYTVTKKWQDGEQDAEYRRQWKAQLTLACEEDGNIVEDRNVDVDGKDTTESYGYVQLPINKDKLGEDESGFVDEILQHEQYGYRPIYKEDGTTQTSKTQELGATEEGKNTETVTYTNLPMYDLYGRLVHYTVTEKFIEPSVTVDGKEETCDYEIAYGVKQYTKQDAQTAAETQTITNTLSDTAEYNWYLLWLDAYREQSNHRPDVYLTIYYREYQYDDDGILVRDDEGNVKYSIKKYGFTEYLWNDMVPDEDENDFWQAVFHLPEYDSNGTKIEYYASIHTSVDKDDFEYIDVQLATGQVGKVDDFTEEGINTSQVTFDEDTGEYTVTHSEKKGVTECAEIDGQTRYLLASDNTFVNQIKEDVTINGHKVWEQLPEGYPVEELPKLTFYMYRIKMKNGKYLLANGDTTNEYDENGTHEMVDSNESDKKVLRVTSQDDSGQTSTTDYQVELVSAIKDLQSSNTTYDFVMKHVGYNTITGASEEEEGNNWNQLKKDYNVVDAQYGSEIAKYDECGHMYKYTIVETVSEDRKDHVNIAYNGLSGTVNGYNITNTFNDTNTNTAPITLQKNWTSKNEDVSITDYPDTKYTLYRFYKKVNVSEDDDKRSDYSKVEMVKSVTLNAADAKAGKVDFGNQLIYSPNLNPYIYFIVETPVKGYESGGFAKTGNIDEVGAEEGSIGWPSLQERSEAYPGMKVPQGWGSCAFSLKETSDDAETNDANADISMTNRYTAEPQATLSGSKVWDDNDNLFGTRPNTLTLYVGRYKTYADSTKQESDFELVGSVTLKNENGNLTAKWMDAEIEDDGTLKDDWKEVTTKTDKGGKNVTGSITVASSLDDKDPNQWSYTITGLDGYYTSGQPYDYAVFELTEDGKVQNYTADTGWAGASKESGTDLREITMGNLKNSNLTSVTVKKEWKDLNTDIEMPEVEVGLQVGITDSNDEVTWYWAKDYFSEQYKNFKYSYEQTLNNANRWQCTYSKLPAGYMEDGTYKEFQYRAAEILIGGKEVEYNTTSSGERTTKLADTQTVPYTITINDKGDQITNATDTTQLTVTKKWENDGNNAYQTRGDVDGDDASQWSVVYHVYRSTDENNSEQVMKPNGTDAYVLYVSGANTESEKSATITGLPVKSPSGEEYTYYAVELDVDGNEIKDNKYYHGSYKVDCSNSTTKQTTVTNSLETTQLSVTKKWSGDQESMRPEMIPLTLYRYTTDINNSEEVTYSDQNIALKADDDHNWTVIYTALPKYDKEGNAYHYYVTESQQDGYEKPEYSGGNNYSTETGGNFSETITNTATQFTLNKVAKDGTTQLNKVTLVFRGEGTRSGITLTWSRDADGQESYHIVKGFTTVSTGSGLNHNPVEIKGLPTGTYKLISETAPNGYTVPKDDLTFTIDENGEISAVSGDLLSVNNDKLTLTMKNNPTNVTLKKVGKDNTEIADGYQFSVSGTFRKDDSEVEEGTRYIGSTSNDEITLANGMLLTSDTTKKDSDDWEPQYLYQLKETNAPVGYTVSDYTVSFYLDEHGDVKIYAVKDKQNTVVDRDKWADIASASATGITFKDQPFAITIVKTDKAGNKLSGAKFKLEKYQDDQTWEEIADGLMTDQNGRVSINSVDKKLSVSGIYRITETKAPDGYILPCTIEGDTVTSTSNVVFKVENDGTIKTGTVEAGVFTEDEKNQAADNTLTFTDDPISITIVKEDFSDSTKLLGVTFELYKKDETGLLSTFTTDDSGKVTIPSSVLAYGNTYQLYEKNYIGYVNEDTGKRLVYEFKINADGTVTETGDYKFGQVVNENQKATITLKNTRIPGTLTVTKVDDTDTTKELKGAEFTLYQEDGTTKVTAVFDGENTTQNRTDNPVTTDADGKAVFENLPWGTYILKETKAPSGYQRSDTEWNVTIGKTGTDIVLVASETIRNTKNVFSFQKYAQGTKTSLSGAKFQLKPASADDKFATTDVSGIDQKFDAKTTDDGKGITWTSVKETPLELKGYLIAGDSYILTEESAPTGYEKNQNSYTFTVSEDGKTLEWKDANDTDGAAIADSKTSLQVYDTPIEITLQKQDAADDKKLADVEFSLEVYDVATNGYTYVLKDDKKLDGNDAVIKTDTNGKAVLVASDGASLVTANEKYRLTETKTPDGYVIYNPALTVVFTVREDGTIVLDRSSSVLASAKDDTLTVKNVKTKLYLEKVDNETGKRLSGSTLEVYMASDFETEQGVLTKPKSGAKAVITVTSEGKTITEEGLWDNTDYVLYEKEAPSGYDSFAPVAFELKNDVVILKDKTRTDITVSGPDDDKAYTITAKDTRIRGHVELTKSVDDSEKSKLANVEFGLYRVNGEEDQKAGTANSNSDQADTQIASGLKTDQDGQWISKGNKDDQFTENDKKVNFATGLPTGNYYFVETKATAGTTLSKKHYAFAIGDSDTGANGKLETVNVVNEVFDASVSLMKVDEVSGEGISCVEFELRYIPEGGTEKDQTTQTGTTDQKGRLTFTGLQKGTYTLTETSADGYDISQTHDKQHQPFKASFTIDDSHQGKEIVINRAAKEDKNLNLTVTQGSLNEDGITNARLLGTVTLYKADGEDVEKALNDVEFTLYKKKESANLWEKIYSFLTGKSYSKQESWSGKTLSEAGKLVIEDLDWGTYKLVETKAKDGYTTTDAQTGKEIETIEFVIDRESSKQIELNTDGKKFYNYQTALLIQKQSQDDKTLSGAEFALKGKYVDQNGETVNGTLKLVTNQQGVIELKGVLIGGETYTLTETKAPDGYQRLTDPLQFTVQKDGVVSIVRDSSGYSLDKTEFFDNQMTVTNQEMPDQDKTPGSGKSDQTKKIENSQVSFSVKTGDSASIGIWLIIMLAALICLLFTRRRKASKNAGNEIKKRKNSISDDK